MHGIDHLILATPDLAAGCDAVEARLGVRPAPGGRHPAFGTHNALLAIGPAGYLEVLAPDPDLAAPSDGRWLAAACASGPRLATWVARTEDIEERAGALGRIGVATGDVRSGERESVDGSRLRWRMTDPYALPLDGVLPFLIAWGDSPHPAGSTPRAGELVGFEIEHPEAELVKRALDVLEVPAVVRAAPAPRLIARIETAAGVVEIA